jgi:hypothetical protein
MCPWDVVVGAERERERGVEALGMSEGYGGGRGWEEKLMSGN